MTENRVPVGQSDAASIATNATTQGSGSLPGPIVVGVTPAQSELVVREAARLAVRFHTTLVCAYVDVSSYTVTERDDGSITAQPLPSPVVAEVGFVPALATADLAAEPGFGEFDTRLAAHLTAVLHDHRLPIQFRQLAGDPAQSLAQLAHTIGAELIVVGSRHQGFRASIHEFLGQSVAVHLIHRQTRPVVVVPVAPVTTPNQPLPWETSS